MNILSSLYLVLVVVFGILQLQSSSQDLSRMLEKDRAGIKIAEYLRHQ